MVDMVWAEKECDCRQAQLQQGHEDYQVVARRQQRDQEQKRRSDLAATERKSREEVNHCTQSAKLDTTCCEAVSLCMRMTWLTGVTWFLLVCVCCPEQGSQF